MRALWLADLRIDESYLITDDSLHHLVNVIRIKIGDDLLLMNGKGLTAKTQVESISKKALKLKFLSSDLQHRKYEFDLALGMPKREALEICLKSATELGFRNIYLIRSEYSQMRIPEPERMEKLIVSALEQSNSPFMPEVLEMTWQNIPWGNYSEAVLLDSQSSNDGKLLDRHENLPKLLIVGPEGGFSPSELIYLHSRSQVKVVNLPTPILRTTTAVITGAGIMIESLLNWTSKS